MNRDVAHLIGRLHGRNAHLQESLFFILRFVGWILEVKPFVRKVPQVFVLGIVGFTVDLEGNIVRFRVFDLLFAALDVPDPPGCDDRHFGRERLDRQFETHLIVALARAAMADRVGALFLGDVHDRLCNDGTRKRRAEQIFVLIDGACLHGREDIVLDKFLLQIEHIEFGRARLLCLFLQSVQFRSLSDVPGDGNDLAVIVIFLEPRDDDGGIKSARVRKNHLFDLLFHLKIPRLNFFICHYTERGGASQAIAPPFPKIFYIFCILLEMI